MEGDAIKKNALLISATQQTFCFEEDRVKFSQLSRIGEFQEEYFYSELFSIYKTKEYYFLFVNRTQAFIVDLNGFVDGNEEELDELFSRVAKGKFINKGKKK